MKVIDLLNKIANGEEVKEFYMNDELWQFDKKENEFHTNKKHKLKMGFRFDELNKEIEIIEEPKKIEKISWNDKSSFANSKMTITGVTEMFMSRTEQLKKSLNEIIDYINKGE